MLRIGLTGPTGSGKSTVTALMRRWGGVAILDADTIAHEVNNSPACTAAIAAAFPGTRLPDGTIDRKALGTIVFSRPEELSRLVGITFPLILAECEARTGKKEEARADYAGALRLAGKEGDRIPSSTIRQISEKAIEFLEAEASQPEDGRQASLLRERLGEEDYEKLLEELPHKLECRRMG